MKNGNLRMWAVPDLRMWRSLARNKVASWHWNTGWRLWNLPSHDANSRLRQTKNAFPHIPTHPAKKKPASLANQSVPIGRQLRMYVCAEGVKIKESPPAKMARHNVAPIIAIPGWGANNRLRVSINPELKQIFSNRPHAGRSANRLAFA